MASLLALLHLLLVGSGFACPPGYSTWYNGECFQMHQGFGTMARTQCNSDGGELVSIHSERENSYLLKQLGTVNYNLWIGLACNETTGEFSWFDGSPLDYTNYAKSNIQCTSSAGYWVDPSDGKWYAGNTFSYIGYPCKLPHKSDSPCDDFDQIGSSTTCVRIFSAKSTWQVAEQSCNSNNADLAAIHSAEVNSYIHDRAIALGLVSGVHIGLTTNSSTKSMAWADGSAVDYSAFAKGFPNDIFGHCSAMNTANGDGSWVSIDCGISTLPYVCGRKAFQPNSTLTGPTCPDNGYFTESGELFSPSYPLPANQSCEYFLAATDGYSVEIVFDDFEANECCDSLSLYDGVLGDNLIATLTGSLSSRKRLYRTSRTNVMRMEWASRSGEGVRGWHAHFTSV